MSDSLKDLMKSAFLDYEAAGVDGSEGARAMRDGLARIEELEAKLAKAVEALGRISSGEFSGQVLTSMPPQDAAAFFARTTLIELRGQDDD